MFSDAAVAVLEKGGVGALILGLLFVLSKLIDKYKPTSERRKEEQDYQAGTIAALRSQIQGYQNDVKVLQSDVTAMRAELRSMSRERHYFYGAITRCIVTHPDTDAWWQAELAAIAQRLREG